jgi:hypothetical protein
MIIIKAGIFLSKQEYCYQSRNIFIKTGKMVFRNSLFIRNKLFKEEVAYGQCKSDKD